MRRIKYAPTTLFLAQNMRSLINYVYGPQILFEVVCQEQLQKILMSRLSKCYFMIYKNYSKKICRRTFESGRDLETEILECAKITILGIHDRSEDLFAS
jgi:hypothetical protein